jgi:hypothetical protein
VPIIERIAKHNSRIRKFRNPEILEFLPYEKFESAFLHSLSDLDWQAVARILALHTDESAELRCRLRQEILRCVSRIDIYFGEQARSFMGAEALAKVYFANGVERWIAFGAGLDVLVPLGANPIQ